MEEEKQVQADFCFLSRRVPAASHDEYVAFLWQTRSSEALDSRGSCSRLQTINDQFRRSRNFFNLGKVEYANLYY
jgi:hypothetical protein